MALPLLARTFRSAARHRQVIAEPLQTLVAAYTQDIPSTSCSTTNSEITGLSNSNAAFQQHFNYGVAARQLHNDLDTYRVRGVTGNVRGAGTASAAYVQLICSHGESDKVVVGQSGDEGLVRGSKVTFDVPVPLGIGPLRRVYVEREKGSCTDTGEGWYLEAVLVEGPAGERLVFPCNSWFGQSDCGDYQLEPSKSCSYWSVTQTKRPFHLKVGWHFGHREARPH